MIAQLFDSHFNGVDLLWLVFAAGMGTLARYAHNRARATVAGAREALERPRPDARMTRDGVGFEFDFKTRQEFDAEVAESQTRFYRELVARSYDMDPEDVQVIGV